MFELDSNRDLFVALSWARKKRSCRGREASKLDTCRINSPKYLSDELFTDIRS